MKIRNTAFIIMTACLGVNVVSFILFFLTLIFHNYKTSLNISYIVVTMLFILRVVFTSNTFYEKVNKNKHIKIIIKELIVIILICFSVILSWVIMIVISIYLEVYETDNVLKSVVLVPIVSLMIYALLFGLPNTMFGVILNRESGSMPIK